MGPRSLWLWSVTVSVIGLAAVAMVSGCTREKALITPTPAATVDQVLSTPSPTAAPTATPVPPEPIYHIVRSGDTAWGIAEQYGISLHDLVAANQLSDADSLQLGQKLIIPEGQGTGPGEEPVEERRADAEGEPGGPRAHIVAEGDTLWSIALEHDTTVEQLATLNELDPDAILSLGQQLLIP